VQFSLQNSGLCNLVAEFGVFNARVKFDVRFFTNHHVNVLSNCGMPIFSTNSEFSAAKMSDNLMDKVSAFGERLKITGTEVSKKMTAGMSSMSFKMKELFQGQTPADKIVEGATSEDLDGPDWNSNLEICDMINTEKVDSVELIRGIKKRIMLKDARVQYLSLVLLETIVKNCDKAFSEVAAERVLDEMVRLIDDPQTVVNNRNKALMLIEAWGESGDELRYLPVYEETYKVCKHKPSFCLPLFQPNQLHNSYLVPVDSYYHTAAVCFLLLVHGFMPKDRSTIVCFVP
jgi:hypothetical protein